MNERTNKRLSIQIILLHPPCGQAFFPFKSFGDFFFFSLSIGTVDRRQSLFTPPHRLQICFQILIWYLYFREEAPGNSHHRPEYMPDCPATSTCCRPHTEAPFPQPCAHLPDGRNIQRIVGFFSRHHLGGHRHPKADPGPIASPSPAASPADDPCYAQTGTTHLPSPRHSHWRCCCPLAPLLPSRRTPAGCRWFNSVSNAAQFASFESASSTFSNRSSVKSRPVTASLDTPLHRERVLFYPALHMVQPVIPYRKNVPQPSCSYPTQAQSLPIPMHWKMPVQ
jgi:hypothetical protein